MGKDEKEHETLNMHITITLAERGSRLMDRRLERICVGLWVQPWVEAGRVVVVVML
jgi:hypothetical protein